MIVQVAFGEVDLAKPSGGHRATYAYRAPEHLPFLKIGALVVVPKNWAHPYRQLATVVGYGRQGYSGTVQNLVGWVKPYHEVSDDVSFSMVPGYTDSPKRERTVKPDQDSVNRILHNVIRELETITFPIHWSPEY